MFKSFSSMSTNQGYVLMPLSTLLRCKADMIVRSLIRASGFLKSGGLIGVVQNELEAGMTGQNPYDISVANIAAISRVRDSAKLASLTLFAIKDLVAQRFISDVSKWGGYIDSIKLQHAAELPYADATLAMRLILEKPVPYEQWHVSESSKAYDMVKLYASDILVTMKKKIIKDDKNSDSSALVTIDDLGYLTQFLIVASLCLDPRQLRTLIPDASQLVSSGALYNHSIVLDGVAAFMHGLINLPIMMNIQFHVKSKNLFGDLFGRIPDSFEVKYVEDLIGSYVPVDLFKAGTIVDDFLRFTGPDSNPKILIEELISPAARKWLASQAALIATSMTTVKTNALSPYSADGIVNIPAAMRAILYGTEYGMFDRPLQISVLRLISKEYSDTLLSMLDMTTLQCRAFNITEAEKISSMINVSELIPIPSISLIPDGNVWSSHCMGSTDDIAYGAVSPTGIGLRFIENRLSFVYGISSALERAIVEQGTTLAYDSDRAKLFSDMLGDYGISSVPYPAMLWRGDNIIPSDSLFTDIAEGFAMLAHMSKRVLCELLITNDMALPTFFSSLGVFIVDGIVLSGYGRPYGLTYEQFAKFCNVAPVIVNKELKLEFRSFTGSVNIKNSMAVSNLTTGRRYRYFEAEGVNAAELKKSLAKQDTVDRKLDTFYITYSSPFKNFCLLPVNNHIEKPQHIIYPKAIKVNDALSTRGSVDVKELSGDKVYMTVFEFKPTFGSDNWFLKPSVIPSVLAKPTDSIGVASTFAKELEKIVEENQTASVPDITKKTDTGLLSSIEEAAAVIAEDKAD